MRRKQRGFPLFMRPLDSLPSRLTFKRNGLCPVNPRRPLFAGGNLAGLLDKAFKIKDNNDIHSGPFKPEFGTKQITEGPLPPQENVRVRQRCFSYGEGFAL